ncbi:MAG: hypothetical protein K6A92_06310 [Lachnospiraceae bacterium]|nr:hypothetical protein [Lachnospiraceae bacterium]
MASKFGKFLVATAAVAAAVAGTYYYTTGKSILDIGSSDAEGEEGENSKRSYVTLDTQRLADTVKTTASSVVDSAKRLSDEAVDIAKSVAKDVSGRVNGAASSTDSFMETLDKELEETKEAAADKVEEFFDDEDDTTPQA